MLGPYVLLLLLTNGVSADGNSAFKFRRYLSIASTFSLDLNDKMSVVVLLFCLPFFSLTGANVATANGGY